MDVLRTKLIGAALLSCLLTTGSPAAELASCSVDDEYCDYFEDWSGVQVDRRGSRGIEVHLPDGGVEAAQIREAITELAFQELAADDILLTELVIKNGSINGSLQLDNLTVPFALRFENISIPTLELRQMEFRKRLIFSNVPSLVKFYANRTEFQQSLEFINGTRFELNPAHLKWVPLPEQLKRDRSVVLQIDKSTIDGDMRIQRTKFFGDVRLYNSKIRPALYILDSNFHASVDILDNAFDSLDIYESTFDDDIYLLVNDIGRLEIKNVRVFNGFQIEQNFVDDYVEIGSIYVNVPGPEAPVVSEAPVVFNNNVISEKFSFSANYFSPWVDRIELEGNTVRGRAALEFPWLWFETQESGIQLNFQNSAFESSLRLGRHRPFAEELYRKIFWEAEEGENSRQSSYIYKASDETLSDSENGQDEGRYCYSSETAPLLVAAFGDVRIARLDWDLPIDDCRYQWGGSGFRYDRWVGEHKDQENAHEGQENWIYQLAAPQPSAIYHVAKQLRAEGRFDRSRDLFYEAKRISYEPRRDGPHGTCGWCWSLGQAESCHRFWQRGSCLRQYMLYGYLYTSGFGVKPEFAAGWLFVTWVLGLLVYLPYSRRASSRRPEIRRDSGLKEDGTWFKHRQTSPPLSGQARTQKNLPPPGFALHQEQEPKRFSLAILSLDATLPVINLQAYDTYFPESFWVRMFSYLQHFVGWILVTSLIASLAVL